MLGRSAPGIRRASGPVPVIADVRGRYEDHLIYSASVGCFADDLQMLWLWFCARALQILRRGLCVRFPKILRLRFRARALQIPRPIILPLAFRPAFAIPTASAAR